jgi:hypothetical protein
MSSAAGEAALAADCNLNRSAYLAELMVLICLVFPSSSIRFIVPGNGLLGLLGGELGYVSCFVLVVEHIGHTSDASNKLQTTFSALKPAICILIIIVL